MGHFLIFDIWIRESEHFKFLAMQASWWCVLEPLTRTWSEWDMVNMQENGVAAYSYNSSEFPADRLTDSKSCPLSPTLPVAVRTEAAAQDVVDGQDISDVGMGRCHAAMHRCLWLRALPSFSPCRSQQIRELFHRAIFPDGTCFQPDPPRPRCCRSC